jgi:hypothetical protein
MQSCNLKTRRMPHSARREAGLRDVLQRIQRRIRLDHIAKKLAEKVVNFFKTKDKKHDLTNQEAALIYKDVDFDERIPLSKKKDVDISWSSHAKWRSDLRDVPHGILNEMIADKLAEMRQKGKPRDRGDVRLKQPGVGTAVVVYENLVKKDKPADATLVTTWK